MVNASFSKDELPEVKRIMNDKRFPEYYRHNFFMYYISIIRYSSKLYKVEIPKIKHFLANANMNALYFVSFSQSFMYVLDFKSTYLYINMIYGKYDYRNTFKEATYMMGITLIPVSFLRRCYFENVYVKYTKSSIDFVENLPATTDTFFAKTIIEFYKYLFNKDNDNMYKIVDTLKMVGVDVYVKDIVEDLEKNK